MYRAINSLSLRLEQVYKMAFLPEPAWPGDFCTAAMGVLVAVGVLAGAALGAATGAPEAMGAFPGASM